MDGNPSIEVIYFIDNGEPMLKLGFEFQNQYLYKVVRMFYEEDKIKSTWIKFKRICKYTLVLFYENERRHWCELIRHQLHSIEEGIALRHA